MFDATIQHVPDYHPKEKETKNMPWLFVFLLFLLFILSIPFLLYDYFISLKKGVLDKVENVKTWYVEFDDEEDNVVAREIGVDDNNAIVVKAPFKDYYGFWADNDADLNFYKSICGAQIISKAEFEELWNSIS